jgi:hypothetical protein
MSLCVIVFVEGALVDVYVWARDCWQLRGEGI